MRSVATLHPEPSERRRRQARLVTLVRYNDHLSLTVEVNDTVKTRWGEPPLQHVAVDHQSTRKLTVAVPLLDGPNVDHQRTGGRLIRQSLGRYRHQVGPCLSQ